MASGGLGWSPLSTFASGLSIGRGPRQFKTRLQPASSIDAVVQNGPSLSFGGSLPSYSSPSLDTRCSHSLPCRSPLLIGFPLPGSPWSSRCQNWIESPPGLGLWTGRPTKLPSRSSTTAMSSYKSRKSWKGDTGSWLRMYSCLPESTATWLLTGPTSVDMYKKQFARWKWNKNVTNKAMTAICGIKRRRDEQDKPTEFLFKGRPVPPQKIMRFERRRSPTLVASSPEPGPDGKPL